MTTAPAPTPPTAAPAGPDAAARPAWRFPVPLLALLGLVLCAALAGCTGKGGETSVATVGSEGVAAGATAPLGTAPGASQAACTSAAGPTDRSAAPAVAAFAGNGSADAHALAERFAAAAGDKLEEGTGASAWRTAHGRIEVASDPGGGAAFAVAYARDGTWHGEAGTTASALGALVDGLGVFAQVHVESDGADGARLAQDVPSAGTLELGGARYDAATDTTVVTFAAPREVAAAPAIAPSVAAERAASVAACRDAQDGTSGRWPMQAGTPGLAVAGGSLAYRFERAPGFDWGTGGEAGSTRGDGMADCPAGWSLAIDAQTGALIAWSTVPCASGGPAPGGV